MAYKVVAIDDDADLLRLVRIKLTKEGFEVFTAVDGEEGVSTVLREKPDVMIIDIMMPKKDGYQVLTEVREKMGKKTPVAIMLTAKAETKDIVKGLDAGADDYITKPFSPRELIERINVALLKRGKDAPSFKK
ncbi:response regulator transcription factor [Candidatus Bathyarchaeota archaeon]|nr:response regulator transcription factor [Candidatus Bathyarchaeota archaeon]